MKSIPNTTFTIKVNDNPNVPPVAETPSATTATLLKITLAQTPDQTQDNPKGGFSFPAMRARNRVADVCDKAKAGELIELEDQDYITARKCVEDFRWSAQHPDLLKFAELFGL